MIATPEAPWSEKETCQAHELFDIAYQREVSSLLDTFQQQAATIDQVDDL